MVCMAMVLCVSCKKDDDPTGPQTVTTDEVTGITLATAVCGGNVADDGGATVTERGVCWSTQPNPTLSDNHTVDGEGIGAFTSEMTDLEPGTKYYVRAYAKNAVGTGYGDEKSFTTLDYEYVDLGLPSGLLWATCNMGAESPEEYGDFYAWGETTVKETYDWSNYKYCNGTENSLTKYCTDLNFGTLVDNKTVLDPEDDAAHVNWGGAWRMPTKDELQELVDNCTYTQEANGGYTVTGPNGNTMFVPAAGLFMDGSVNLEGMCCFLWSNSLNLGEEGPFLGYYVNFFFGVSVGIGSRCCGINIRPVRPAQN